MTKHLPLQIEKMASRLLQLKARQRLFEQAEKARTRKTEKRSQAQKIAALLRSEDAHRKIQLGGVVIAAGADKYDPAELCGLLLMALRQITPEKLPHLKEIGLKHFEARKPTGSKQ